MDHLKRSLRPSAFQGGRRGSSAGADRAGNRARKRGHEARRRDCRDEVHDLLGNGTAPWCGATWEAGASSARESLLGRLPRRPLQRFLLAPDAQRRTVCRIQSDDLRSEELPWIGKNSLLLATAPRGRTPCSLRPCLPRAWPYGGAKQEFLDFFRASLLRGHPSNLRDSTAGGPLD